ncbi:D-alanine--poly(phosphoribitol) ligase [Ktedonosporobacter rubrisoli]|uniref:D-alanine--poly(Phosphoribitol) ligase n=1 Tax=Ktedonosporobacter rubrisoli TaxID=2509675 RepID=A0A4P6JNN4_KTERU|nr:amino acid adenylation domain-containing protein [Ktedonosporobacter rubrisoli]QBD76783.1 D-alanine--poly(phosphoribitol) ligase [Ktedonosporobacter rubrisoli]
MILLSPQQGEQAVTQQRLHSFFLESAANFPSAPVLSIGNQEWSYARLAEDARRYAQGLLTACQGRLERVGVFAYRSYVAYAGTLASLLAGATCVPLNKTFPSQRTQRMIEQAELDAIIVDATSLPQLQCIWPQLKSHPVLLLPEHDAEEARCPGAHLLDCRALARLAPLHELPEVSALKPAYLLFTSGSTGVPKGVPVTHQNVVAFLRWNLHKYQFTPADRFTQTFDQTFDLSFFDLFMAWGSGACLCVPQPIQLLAPFAFVKEQRITVWFSVPSVISHLLKKQFLEPSSLPSLRWSLFCGEALPQSAAVAWQEAAPNSIIENLYGPTELTIACASYRWDAQRSPDECANGFVPLGQLYPHLKAVVVDEARCPVAPGECGELCVAGPQVFPGYWQNPEKNATVLFVPPGEDCIYYRTGDLVRLQGDNYVYLGRIDHQVKIQGYRIELGEIEALLRQEGQVVEAAAIGWPLEEGQPRGIVAFVSGCNMQASELLQRIKRFLPNYMHPQAIYVLECMPYNANGKIDRAALHKLLE